ncbi:MAG TPA: branched-chain amino acid ABC transporter permease [Micromonosporaceae bacterium]|nr:branched-chain amino acid ABC transporter permease [Micromonosporaceae bacterium]HCU52567.1 branched-chain amino acid ABC transporter permease [Micromonosporaceae bacterium]
MTSVLETVVRGLGLGSVYALLALGFVIIYKATRVISFAQPAFMLTGVVMVTYLVQVMDFWLALLAAVALSSLLGLVAERLVIRPMVGRPVFTVAIITLGVDVALRVVANAFMGLEVRQVGDPWGLRTFTIGSARVEHRDIASVAAMLIVMAMLFAFFRFSRWGLAMRAAAGDQEAALLQGVSVGAVFAMSWAMAAGLAAVAGTFHAAGSDVDGSIWVVALVALPVIILGGLDSLAGAVIAGLAVGVLQETAAKYQHLAPWLGANIAPLTPYLLMMLVLLFRPYGLLGTRDVERV